MKSTKIRDYLEIVGLLGVILSLLFVGYELRQNSKIAKIEAYQAYTSNVIDITLEMSSDPALAALVMRTFGDLKFEELNPEQYGVLFSYYLAHVTSRSGLFIAIEEGIVSESYGAALQRTTFFDTDVFRKMWPLQRREFDEEFVEFFEGQAWNAAK